MRYHREHDFQLRMHEKLSVSQAQPGTQWESPQHSHTLPSWIWGRGTPILGKDTKGRGKKGEKGKGRKKKNGVRRYLIYNLRERSHNRSLITKTSYLNEQDFFIRILYKNCYD